MLLGVLTEDENFIFLLFIITNLMLVLPKSMTSLFNYHSRKKLV